MTGRNLVEDACEEIRRERDRDSRTRPLNPDRDLSWENLDRMDRNPDFHNLDFDNGYYD